MAKMLVTSDKKLKQFHDMTWTFAAATTAPAAPKVCGVEQAFKPPLAEDWSRYEACRYPPRWFQH